MKKFMLLAVLFLLLPACTSNPHLKNAMNASGTIAGAVVGYKESGGNILGGLFGAYVGNQLVRAATYDPSENTNVVYVSGGSSYQYGDSGAMCRDIRSGGSISCDFLQRNPRYECCGIVERNYQPVQYQNQQVRTVSYSSNVQSRASQSAPRRVAGMTVDNYLQVNDEGKGMVPEECRTKNWAVASICVKKWSKALADLQKRCIAGEQNPDCESNPGVMASEAAELADQLELKQKEAQGGVFVSSK